MNDVYSENHSYSKPRLPSFRKSLAIAFKYAALSLITATAMFLLGLLLSTFPEDLPIYIKLMRALGVVVIPSTILVSGALLWSIAQQPDTADLQKLASVFAVLIAAQFVVAIGVLLASVGN